MENIPFPSAYRSDPNASLIEGDSVKAIILQVDLVRDATDHPGDPVQFNANNFTFFNSDNWGTSELRIGNYDPNSTDYDQGDGGDIMFNGGLGDAIEIHMIDPTPDIGEEDGMRNYTIENMNFNDLRSETILVEDDQNSPLYEEEYLNPFGNITISGNSFLAFARILEPWQVGGEDMAVFGIHFFNMDAETWNQFQLYDFWNY